MDLVFKTVDKQVSEQNLVQFLKLGVQLLNLQTRVRKPRLRNHVSHVFQDLNHEQVAPAVEHNRLDFQLSPFRYCLALVRQVLF